ncbi:hypothetical protein DFS34DRAFT_646938 [Phlyctochytrium arcticum]|nr:hypothetical protein DFS34DRAFT_646938 [Phlyctochytrium arcticum]
MGRVLKAQKKPTKAFRWNSNAVPFFLGCGGAPMGGQLAPAAEPRGLNPLAPEFIPDGQALPAVQPSPSLSLLSFD